MISYNKQQHKQQRGNTLLGLIIGALVGLGAALAVAVYVTKVPVPFLNKTSPRSADTDAAEAKKNKDWDPNVPLAGKNPVKPSPRCVGPGGYCYRRACNRCGFPVQVRPVGCKNPCGNCGTVYPLGDCSD